MSSEVAQSPVAIQQQMQEESKDVQSLDHTAAIDVMSNTAHVGAESQYSHLFPAHLYVKKLSTGQEFDHNEDVDAENDGTESKKEIVEPNKTTLMLFDHESKVQIGADTNASSYDRVPVDKFGA